MNFLKDGASGLTYKEMLYVLFAWLLFLSLLYGVQYFRMQGLKQELVVTRERVGSLDAEKDRQIEMVKLVGKKRVGLSARHDLVSIIANRPRWENMIRAMSRALPSDVWLESVRAAPKGEWYSVEIAGKTKSQRALTTYILKLEESGFFSRTTLEGTQLADAKAGVFDFKLTTEPVAQRLLRDE